LQFCRLAGIELEHVTRRLEARIRRTGIAGRTGRHIPLLADQPARVVEIQDVQRDTGVLHPVRLRLLPVMDEQHAVAGFQMVAEHQPACAAGVVLCHFHLVAGTGQLHPVRAPGAGATGKGEQGTDEEQAHKGHGGDRAGTEAVALRQVGPEDTVIVVYSTCGGSPPTITTSAGRRANRPTVTTPGIWLSCCSSLTGSTMDRLCTSRIRLPLSVTTPSRHTGWPPVSARISRATRLRAIGITSTGSGNLPSTLTC